MRISEVRGLSRARKEIAAGAPLIPKKIVDRIANGEKRATRSAQVARDDTALSFVQD